MRLFKRQPPQSKLAAFDSRLRSPSLQRKVIEANTFSPNLLYEAMLGRRAMPLFTTEIRAAQAFADFRPPNEDASKLGLARFFRRPGGWFTGGKP